MGNKAASRADSLVYLDLDGVVHHSEVICTPRKGIHVCQKIAPGRYLFEWLPIFFETIRTYPELGLVLSSSWCVKPGYGETMKRMPQELRNLFCGGTFHRRIHGATAHDRDGFCSTPRWLQIWNDVQRRQPARWLALDDDTSDWPDALRPHLIACEGSSGLSCLATQSRLADSLAKWFLS